MRWIGLTGGIASGKTTVANYLRNEGVAVADADQVAAHIVRKGSSGLASVITAFGRDYLNSAGELDRRLLAQKIFTDEIARLELESLLHPLIQRHVANLRAGWEKEGRAFAVYDVPLLFEKKMESQFDSILLIATDENEQRKRLMTRNQLSNVEAHSRLLAQIPISQKINLSHDVIFNSGTLLDLEKSAKDWLTKQR